MKKPIKYVCTPYLGKFDVGQTSALLGLLWPYLKPVPGTDLALTGWGKKTKTGLLVAIEHIVNTRLP